MVEPKRKLVSAWLKHILLVVVLIVATLLLLELPQLYFAKADEKLLLESDSSTYTLKAVNTEEISFQEKLGLFQDNGKGCWFGEPEVFKEEALREAENTMAEEIALLLNGLYAPITIALQEELAVSEGFRVRVIYNDQEKRYSWEIGLLVFTIPDLKWVGRVIWDMESNKIFILQMEMLDWESGIIFLDNADGWDKTFTEYYYAEEIDVWEEFDGHVEISGVLLAPIPCWIMENSDLMQELAGLYDKLFGMYGILSQPFYHRNREWKSEITSN